MFEFIGNLAMDNTFAFAVIALVSVLLAGVKIRSLRRDRDADLDIEYQNMLREQDERETENINY